MLSHRHRRCQRPGLYVPIPRCYTLGARDGRTPRESDRSGAKMEPPGNRLSPALEGRRIHVRGTVQGVGMRPFVYRLARELGVAGRVRNDARGVTIEAFAPPELLDAFAARLAAERPPAAALDAISSETIPHEPAEAFV